MKKEECKLHFTFTENNLTWESKRDGVEAARVESSEELLSLLPTLLSALGFQVDIRAWVLYFGGISTQGLTFV